MKKNKNILEKVGKNFIKKTLFSFTTVILSLALLSGPAVYGQDNVPEMQNNVGKKGTQREVVEIEEDKISKLYEENKVLELKNVYTNDANGNKVDLTDKLAEVKTLSSATIHMEVKFNSNNQFSGLFSASSTSHMNNYFLIYSNKGKIGVEGRNERNFFYDNPPAGKTNIIPDQWNAVTVIINSQNNSVDKFSLYINGKKAYTSNKTANFIKDVIDVDRMQLGTTPRSNQTWWGTPMHVRNMTIYNKPLTDEEVAARSILFKRETYKEQLAPDMVISEPKVVFESGRNGGRAADNIYSYRIPALLRTAQGTLIASADARETHSADWGNIGITIRRSTDDGENWGNRIDAINIRDNPHASNGSQQSPVTIDSVLVQNPDTNRIFLIYDMFLEGRAIHSLPNRYEDPYVEVDGKTYRALYSSRESGTFTIRDDGYVYRPNGEKTDYHVVLTSTAPARSDLGDIYQGNNLIGNIYFTTNKTSPFRAASASYLWMQYSDDDGLTWSDPTDISKMVSNSQIKFHGVGPGAGIVLKHGQHKGRIVVPTYTTNHQISNHLDSQSSRVIYSDDNGVTWHRGDSPNDNRTLPNGSVIHSLTMSNGRELLTESTVVELDNGQLKLFMRNLSGRVRVATSDNGGESWRDLERLEDVVDVYVQLSAVHTHYNDKEYVILANANGPRRANGYVRVAEVGDDGSMTWLNHKLIQGGEFAYNSLVDMGNGNYGILYEHVENGYNAYSLWFKKFNMKYAIAQTKPTATVTSVEKLDDNHFRLNFDKNVLVIKPENLELADGSMAYFVSQDSENSLIYTISRKDWGKAIKSRTSDNIINVNKIDVNIDGVLPDLETANVNDYDILRRVNNVQARRIKSNKASISYAPFDDATGYIITRTDRETNESVEFRTPNTEFVDRNVDPAHRYVYNVKANYDRPNGDSLPAEVSAQKLVMDDRDEDIEYGKAFGDWPDRNLYGGTEKFVDITGNTTLKEEDYTAKVRFVGTGIEIYGIKSDNLSTARVKIDGVDMGEIDFYSANESRKVFIARFENLSDSEHIMEIIVNNKPVTRPRERNKISLDSFNILTALPPDQPEVNEEENIKLVANKSSESMDDDTGEKTEVYDLYFQDEQGVIVSPLDGVNKLELPVTAKIKEVYQNIGGEKNVLDVTELDDKIELTVDPNEKLYVVYAKSEEKQFIDDVGAKLGQAGDLENDMLLLAEGELNNLINNKNDDAVDADVDVDANQGEKKGNGYFHDNGNGDLNNNSAVGNGNINGNVGSNGTGTGKNAGEEKPLSLPKTGMADYSMLVMLTMILSMLAMIYIRKSRFEN